MPGRRPASRKLGLGPNPRPTARSPLLTQRGSHALQTLDEMPGGAATTRCAAGVRPRRSTPRFHTLATSHGSALALGCARRPGPCTRASTRGGRRVGSVAGHDAAAAGVSRRGGTSTCTHVLLKSRVEARITITSCAPSPNARPTTARRHVLNQNPQTRRALGPRARWRGATRCDAVRRGIALPTFHLHKRHGTKASLPTTQHSDSRLDGQPHVPPTHGDGTFQGRSRSPAWGGRGASRLHTARTQGGRREKVGRGAHGDATV
jgi:hypothetical protein